MQKQIKDIFNREPELEAKIKELEKIMSSSAKESEKLSSARTLVDEMRKEILETQYQAVTDDLTGFLRKRVIKEVYAKKVAEASRNKEYLSLILMDIDHMKIINDTLGHLAGTKVIEKFARAISKSIRGQDLPSRYGGDEFLILCIHKKKHSVESIVGRIRKNICEIKLSNNLSSNASFGYACRYSKEAENTKFEELFEEADKRLYAEKKSKKLTGK